MTVTISKRLLNYVRPSDHSTFSPSAADQWLSCAARTRLVKDIPSESSKYSDEGTLAHSVCEAVFRQEWYGIPVSAELNMQLAMLDDRGNEMLESAHGYSSVLQTWLNDKDSIGDVIWFGLEKGIPIYPEEGCFGTADCIVVGTKGAAIIDFKYGKGKDVGAGSLQLKVYATGVWMNLMDMPLDYQFHAVVYQPRTSPAPKHHPYDIGELHTFSARIFEAIRASKDTTAEPCEGNHCFWCPARRTHNLDLKCPIIKDKPLKLAQENFGQFLKDMNMPGVLTHEFESTKKRDEAMLKLMALAPLVAQIAEDAENEFNLRLQSGEVVPGLMMTEQLGNRKYNASNDEEAAKLIKEHFPEVDPLEVKTVKKLKTITQLEKVLGKGKLDSICVRPMKKKLKVMDEKTREILGQMEIYGNMITASQTHNSEE